MIPRRLLPALALASPALAEGPIRPAEAPPADYAGQQYVDSRGCVFLRAGTPGNIVWVPRVTRQGAAMCGNPPSGRRVPVAGEGAAAAPLDEPPAPVAGEVAATGAFFVAVGSFGVAANVDKALAQVQALNYPATRGRAGAGGGLVTVLAGPFPSLDAARAARQALRAQGFPDAIVVGP